MESKSFEKDNLREALHDVVDEMDKEKVRELLHEDTNRRFIQNRDQKYDLTATKFLKSEYSQR